MRVIAPASTANLGPGFDTLGLALDLPFELITADSLGDDARVRTAESPGDGTNRGARDYLRVEEGHPAQVAYHFAGGDPELELLWRSPIPPGRGLGFSGAARVAGAFLAQILRATDTSDPAIRRAAADIAFSVATQLEGHPDNAAASAFGGFCVADREAVRVEFPGDLADHLAVIAWSPQGGTSTRSARAKLAESVPLVVASRSIAGSSLWVAAVATGRLDLLRAACVDQLHQPQRLASRADSAEVLDWALSERKVIAAWLSGSGPSVAALAYVHDAEELATDLSQNGPEGVTRVLRIASSGVDCA